MDHSETLQEPPAMFYVNAEERQIAFLRTFKSEQIDPTMFTHIILATCIHGRVI